MKETYYFSHDYNATQDPKLMAILSNCGLSGIGMYWILIEIIHQQPESRILYKSYEDYIDFYGRLDGDSEHLLNKIKQMLITTELFVKDGDYIYSKRVLENKKQREILSEKRSLAGKKSAEIRYNRTNVEQVLNKGQQGKERKGKERKVKEISTIVDTTIVEKVNKSNEDINWLIEEFKSVMKFKSAGGKNDRFMAKHLLNNFSREQLTAMLVYCATQEYAPRVGSVEKLWYKRGDILAGIKSSKPNLTIIG